MLNFLHSWRQTRASLASHKSFPALPPAASETRASNRGYRSDLQNEIIFKSREGWTAIISSLTQQAVKSKGYEKDTVFNLVQKINHMVQKAQPEEERIPIELTYFEITILIDKLLPS